MDELKKLTSILQEVQEDILELWVSDTIVSEGLKKLMTPNEFKEKFAREVFEYYIGVINEQVDIGDCPAMKRFLHICSYQEIAPHELFMICSGFKKALISTLLKKNLLDEDVLKELSNITDRNLSGLLELYKDIIQRKNETIEEQEGWIRQYINVINRTLIVSTTDTQGVITHVNKNFCDISGYSMIELVGRPHSIIRHPDTPKSVFEDMWKTIKSKKPWTGILKNRRKDGKPYYVSTVIFPLLNTKGEVIEYMSTRTDLTELFLLQEEREQEQRAMLQHAKMIEMGEMVGMIAHQWKQPLNIINMQSISIKDMIEDGDLSDEKLLESLQKIEVQTSMMDKITTDFRNFYKPEREKTLFKACECANEVFELMGAKLKKLQVTTQTNKHEHFEVFGYPNDFKQAILNLFSNSCDNFASKKIKNPKITLDFSKDSEYGYIYVSDNGGGIDSSLLPTKLFDGYVTTKGDEGTGLGLKLCKTIIEDKMEGSLSVKNQDGGATFIIKLPLAKRA
ncbi:MAG: PAS domain-containing sensor histidine kinase [Campylobacterales bacterium]